MTDWTAGQARAAMGSAPIVSLDALCPPGSVLVVAPHPDDESLGCGGLIALAAQAGRTVLVAVLTDGAGSHPGSLRFTRDRLAALRKAEAQEAAARLGRSVTLGWFGAADGDLAAGEAQAVAWLSNLCAASGATTVLTTWEADPHPDHKAAFRIATQAAGTSKAALLAYPIWGLTLPDDAAAGPPAPCWRLEVSSVLSQKEHAVAAHRSQITALIDDDPKGFRLHAEDLARHAQAFEPYLQIRMAYARLGRSENRNLERGLMMAHQPTRTQRAPCGSDPSGTP